MRKKSYVGQIIEDVKTESYEGMKRLTENREHWRAATITYHWIDNQC
jgi:hypothetical protein